MRSFVLVVGIASIIAANQASEAASDRITGLPGVPSSLQGLSQFAGKLQAGDKGELFYWLVECETAPESAPLVLWLQGGPGASSLFSLFSETGPFRFASGIDGVSVEGGPTSDAAPSLAAAEVRWTTVASVLYLDQPFGTGFSWASANTSDAVVHDEAELRNAALAALLSFYDRHERYAGRPLYIVGESFAGHMAPNIAWRIVQHNEDPMTRPSARIALRGLAVGDGWVEPTAQNIAFPAYAFGVGLIGEPLRDRLALRAKDCARTIAAGNYTAAFDGPCYYHMLNPIVDAAGGVSPYDIRVFSGADARCSNDGGNEDCNGNRPAAALDARAYRKYAAYKVMSGAGMGAPADDDGFAGDLLQSYLDADSVRDALHLPRASASWPWGQGPGATFVEEGLIPDLNAPTSLPLWPKLLDRGVQVVAYNGNFDLICNHMGTDSFLRTLDWDGREDFLAAPRRVWRTRGSMVAGWARSARNLTQLVVANAGHMAPSDAPLACFDMMERLLGVNGASFPVQ